MLLLLESIEVPVLKRQCELLKIIKQYISYN